MLESYKQYAKNAGFENGTHIEEYDVSENIAKMLDKITEDLVWEMVRDMELPIEYQVIACQKIRKIIHGG